MGETMSVMVAQMAELKARMRAQGKQGVHQLVKEFLAEHPDVTCVRWTQFTPYFNDGDACVFGIGSVAVTGRALKARDAAAPEDDDDDDDVDDLFDDDDDDDDEDEDDEDLEGSPWVSSYGKGALAPVARGLEKLLGEAEEVLELALGDHLRVYATATRLVTEEYEHE